MMNRIIKTDILLEKKDNLLNILKDMEEIEEDIYKKINVITNENRAGLSAEYLQANYEKDYQISLELNNALKNIVNFIDTVKNKYEELDNIIIKTLDNMKDLD